jgi:hypothetical protein
MCIPLEMSDQGSSVCIANEDLDVTLKQSKGIEMMQFNKEFTAGNTDLFLPWSPCSAGCCVICKQYAKTPLLARRHQTKKT